jgi:spermidine synthase
LDAINENVAAELEKNCRYYNREIHKSVFVLPNYVKAVFEIEKTGVSV